MSLFYLIALGLLMQAARTFSVGNEGSGPAGVLLAMGYVLLTAFFVGGLFERIRLPRLTGYIVAGLVAGPFVLGLLTERMVEQLAIVNGMAVSLIALTAGTEMDFRSMRALLRPISGISLVAVPLTGFLLTLVILGLKPYIPFLEPLPLPALLASALVLGVVLSAQSPSVAVALRDELRAEGPVSRTVLGVVVCGDFLVILLFAATSALARSTLGVRAEDTGALAWELAGSLVIGSVLGGILGLYLSRVKSGTALFVLAVAFAAAEIGTRVHLDPLLISLAAGLVVRNATRQGERLLEHITDAALPVYLLFFAIAGASIHLDVLESVGIPALVLVLVRGAGLFAGSRIGARLANAPEPIRRWAGFGLLPQAGLALALSLLFVDTFPQFGEHARALTLGVVALNEIAAPGIYRFALVRAGEVGARAAPAAPAVPEQSQASA